MGVHVRDCWFAAGPDDEGGLVTIILSQSNSFHSRRAREKQRLWMADLDTRNISVRQLTHMARQHITLLKLCCPDTRINNPSPHSAGVVKPAVSIVCVNAVCICTY